MVFQTVIGGYRSLELVSWANGTPAQLAAMLDAHYSGRINIANYWSVGDTRRVTLEAIDANDCTSAMSEQLVELVLMNVGGKTLVNAEHGVSNCAFVVGFKNCLTGFGHYNTSSTAKYTSSAVRAFLNNQLFIALPTDLQNIFKSFVNKTTEYTGSSRSLVSTEDLLALPATMEVSGTKPSTGILDGEGSLFSYYSTTANRIKTISGAATSYWTRSALSSSLFAYVTGTGSYSNGDPVSSLGISPFGVI